MALIAWRAAFSTASGRGSSSSARKEPSVFHLAKYWAIVVNEPVPSSARIAAIVGVWLRPLIASAAAATWSAVIPTRAIFRPL